MRRFVRRAVLLATLVGGLVGASDAGAAITFPEPEKISAAGRNASGEVIAVGSDDRAFVAWTRFDGEVSRIQGRWIEPDGSLGPTQYLRSGTEDVRTIDLVIDGGGRATVAWTVGYPDRRIQSRRILPDGSMEPVQTLSDPSHTTGDYAIKAVVDPSDRVTVLWEESDASVRSVRLAADGTPGSRNRISPSGHDTGLEDASVDPLGRVFVTWFRYDVEPDKLAFRRIEADRTLGPVKTVESDFDVNAGGQIHAVSSDEAVVIWGCCNPVPATDRQLRGRTVAGDGTLGPVHDISPLGDSVPFFNSAFDNTDHGTVAWKRDDGSSGTEVVARRIDADGAPSSPIRVLGSAVDTNRVPGLAIDSLARTTIVWPRADGKRMYAVRMDGDGTRGPLKSFSEVGGDNGHPQVAIGPDNRPAIVWSATEDTDSRIYFTLADLVAPETTITSGPLDGSTTPDDTPTFEFTSNADAPAFACSTDGGPFTACIPPATLAPLAEGAHSFAVRATDDDGTDATPAEVDFTYDPDADPPDIRVEGRVVKASATQKQQGKRIAVAVKAGAGEDVTLTATGTVDPKGKKKPVDLQKQKDKAVDAGDLRKLELEPRKSKDEKALVKSLKKDGPAKAKIKVVLTDGAGNDTSKSVSVKLK